MNANNIVGQDVYRVRERIHSNTLKLAKLKHRKAGEFQEVPLPRSVGEAIERYVDKYGTTPDGHLLRGPGGYFTKAARILDAGLWEAAGFHRFGKQQVLRLLVVQQIHPC
ncbi:hypothetical protein [Streptomyces hydrogenans]|uniref:hypothetical protein n=1 Tax=Streptomyces hydrogenans TaxID=1873719 RepID=UPI0035D610BF